MKKNIDLARIFNFEALAEQRNSGFHLMSSASALEGGSNDHNADFSERLKLLRQFISTGRVPKKPDGVTIYADHELLALPFERMQALYDATTPSVPPGERGQNLDENNPKAVVKPDPRMQPISMAAIFNNENNITMLSARLDRSHAAEIEADKLSILNEIVRSGKMPISARGEPFTPDGLIALPVSTLKMLLANLR